MMWFSRLLSNVPGTPATHSFVILIGTITVSVIALYRIDTIDIATYSTCVGGLAAAAGGATWVSAKSEKIAAETQSVVVQPHPPTP